MALDENELLAEVASLRVRDAPPVELKPTRTGMGPKGAYDTTRSEFARDERAKEVARLCVAGHSLQGISIIMGLSYNTVSTYFRRPGVREYITERNEQAWYLANEEIAKGKVDLVTVLKQASSDALQKIIDLMQSEDERVVYRAASDILDRNPQTSKTHKVESTERILILDPTQLAQAALAAQEMDRKTIEGDHKVLPNE